MAGFKDNEGREWKLRLNAGLVGAIRRETSVDLGMVAQDASWVSILFGDFEKLIAVLWSLCEGQAEKHGITPERFAYLFDGEVLEEAGGALTNAIVDFFPRSQIARALKEKLPAILAETDRRAISEMDKIAQTFLNSAGNSPGSAGSMPTP